MRMVHPARSRHGAVFESLQEYLQDLGSKFAEQALSDNITPREQDEFTGAARLANLFADSVDRHAPAPANHLAIKLEEALYRMAGLVGQMHRGSPEIRECHERLLVTLISLSYST